jgi:transcriptional regulator with XRE-family HTH domain
MKKGLNQRSLAGLVDMREATLSRYENDKRLYQWDYLIKIADALDTSTDYLLGRTDISASIRRLTHDANISEKERSFFEVYDKLDSDDKNLMMERAVTIYDIRKRDNKADKE